MEILLTVGKIYQLYTKYESIAGEKVKIIGTLAYSEVEKVPYNVTVLAINERVISVKDEELEEKISGDTIYHCRSVSPKPDGSYAEYIVWDSIINMEKTIKINEVYQYILNIHIDDALSSPITQVISDLEKYINSLYPTIQFSVQLGSESEDTSVSQTGGTIVSQDEEKLLKAMAIIDALNNLEHRLIPAANAIIESDLTNKVNTIVDDFDIIKQNIQIIANNV